MRKAIVQKIGDGINDERYTFEGNTSLGGGLVVDIFRCEPDNTRSNSLPVLWKKYGYIDRILSSYWCVETFAYDDKGGCYMSFNPTVIKGKCEINFDWMLEATEENKEKLIDKICDMAFKEIILCITAISAKAK